MNRQTYAVTTVSVIIAVALWAIATWLEDDAYWQLQEPPQTEILDPLQVRPDSEVRTIADSISCETAETQLRARVEAAQSCSSDEDCTLFDYGYPIQCLTSVAKDHISELRSEYSQYEQSCAFRVYYDCPTGPMERQAVCRSNRCVVELRSNDILEEETREFLRLEQR
ncbi:MAG: hypothetical protein R3192_08955 [Woeseiaceae bacterium]|nr:hypothetical protein [Woeseiaceae bacterium]